MTGAVLAWSRRPEPRAGWTNDELAELYRVEHALNQAAFAVETDRGVSDEGDPWFVFCHSEGGVVVHIARIDGLYYLYCVTLPNPLVGSSFAALTKTYIASLPTPPAAHRGGGVVVHPSALLSLLVAAAMFSVDALMQHSAHAADLPAAPHRDFLLGDYKDYDGGSPAKAGVVQSFTATFTAAVWRDRGADDLETVGAWRTVEQAALSFAALYDADLAVEASGKAAPGEPPASPQDVSQPLAAGASQVGAEGSGQSYGWGDSSSDEHAAGWASPSGAVAPAAQSAPMLAKSSAGADGRDCGRADFWR